MGNVIKKVVVGLIVGGALWGTTAALGFPTVFQMMFFAYALLGTAVFLLLDAPSIKPVGGVKAVGAMVVYGPRESIPWFVAYVVFTAMSGAFDYFLASG